MSPSSDITISSKVAREDGAGVVLCVKARDRTGATGDPAIPAFTINVQDIDLVIIVMIHFHFEFDLHGHENFVRLVE